MLCAVEDDMAPCKFAEKVWNAQEAGAQGVRKLLPVAGIVHASLSLFFWLVTDLLDCSLSLVYSLQQMQQAVSAMLRERIA